MRVTGKTGARIFLEENQGRIASKVKTTRWMDAERMSMMVMGFIFDLENRLMVPPKLEITYSCGRSDRRNLAIVSHASL
jgi:hypothetical protein